MSCKLINRQGKSISLTIYSRAFSGSFSLTRLVHCKVINHPPASWYADRREIKPLIAAKPISHYLDKLALLAFTDSCSLSSVAEGTQPKHPLPYSYYSYSYS